MFESKVIIERIASIALLVLAMALTPAAKADDAVGDYRTIATGNWNGTAVWETCTVAGNPGTWVATSTAPTASSGVITIRSGHTVTTSSSTTADQIVVASGGTLTVSSTLNVANGTGTDLDVFGTVLVTGNSALILAATATVVVESGGVLQHGIANSIISFGSGATCTIASGGTYQVTVNFSSTSLNIAACTWSPGSTLLITGETGGTSIPNGFGQAFWNIVWNCPSQTGNLNFSGGLTTVNGDITVISTGTGSWRLTGNTALTLAIGGNLNIQGGTFTLSTGSSGPTVNLTGNLTISGTGTLEMNNGGTGTSTLNMVAGNVSIPTGTIKKTTAAASGVVVFKKAGTQTLTGGGTFGTTVDWTVNSGTILQMLTGTAFGGNVNVNGTLDLNGQSGVSLNALNGTGSVKNNGANTTLTLGQSNGTGDFSGLVTDGSGTIAIAKSGTGTATFRNPNSFSGKITITGGRLDILSDACLGLVPGSVVADAITLNGGSLSTTNNFTLNPNRGIVIGASGGTISPAQNPADLSSFVLTYNGIIGGTSGGAFIKGRNGVLILGGANTYNGATTINSGGSSISTVRLAASGVIPDGSAVSINNATFDLSGFSETIGSLASAANGFISLGSGTLTCGGDNTSTAVLGAISGAGGSLVKEGTGTLTLSGNNFYSGTTTVNGGTLSVSSSSSLGTGNVTVNSATLSLAGNGTVGLGAVLSLNGSSLVNLNYAGTMTINKLFFNGLQQDAGTWGALGSGAAHQDSRFAGAGLINVQLGPLVISCSSNITATATGPGGAMVSYSSTATGGCSPPPTLTCNPPSGSSFPVGTTTVTCFANDACGTSTNCSFTVTVYPQLYLTCPSNITATSTSQSGAVVTYSNSSSGGCTPPSVVCNPPSGSTFPVGTTTVNCTASDTCGGSTGCVFTVSVSLLNLAREIYFPLPLLPPTNGLYINPYAAQIIYPNGIIIKNVRHRRFPPGLPVPPLGGSQNENFSSQLDFDLSTDGGTSYQSVSGTANVSIQVTHSSDSGSTAVCDTEMLALDLTAPAGGMLVRLRESPTLQSTGQTTVRADSGGYMIGSFFDVFAELSLDNGVTWLPGQNPHHVELRKDPSTGNPVPVPTPLLPPPTEQYVSPALWHALYAQGIVIRDVRHKLFTGSLLAPPPGGTNHHNFNSQVDLQVSSDGGVTYQYVRVAAPVNVTVAGVGGGFYDTEMDSLDLSLPGGIMLRESPSLPSRGGTAIEQLPDGTFQIDSFFDVFTELSLDGGASWSAATNGPVTMELRSQAPENPPTPTPNLPPLAGGYVSPDQWHALYASGIIITNVSHSKFLQTQPPPPPGGSQTENFGSDVSGLISMDGGATFQPFSASANVAVQVTSRADQDNGNTRFFDTEMQSLSLSGGSLPAGVMVRESPSRASLGRTSVRQDPGDGQYRIGSFFDVFTEISTDSGTSWSPAVTHPGTMAHRPLTNVPPLSITCPSNITVVATSPAGRVVTYTVGTSGGCPPVNVVCNPPSGSTFPVGTTTVCCTASDACSQSANCCFNVTVKKPVPQYYTPYYLLPPPGTVYISPALWHVLYANGIVIRDVRHRFFTDHLPPPSLGTAQVHVFGSQVDYEVSFDNGNTFQPGSGSANVQVRVTHTQDIGDTSYYDTEMLSLDLFGAGFQLRESPTLQSTGQTTVRPVAGGYLVGSFFDVNTEVSTDGGVSWTPAQDSAHVELRNDPATVDPVDHPTTLLPPPTGAYVSPQQWHALYAAGIVIKDVSHKFFTGSIQPPTPGSKATHSFDSQVDMSISTDGGATYQFVRVTAPVQVSVTGVGSGASGFYDTEMLELTLNGLPGGLMLRESPSLPSRGGTLSRVQADGTYRLGSFFDIFTELSTDGGASWSGATNGPVRMELRPVVPEVPKPNPNLPPLDGTYISPAKWHALYASGIVITNATHNRFTQTQPPPPPGGSQTENFGSQVTGLISMDGGATFQPFSAPANVAIQVTSSQDSGNTRFFNTEMLSLSLSGGTLPGGVMVRESPSKASLGRTSVRTTASDYRIGSFFDIFTEVSLDGGATWSPSVVAPGTMGLRPPPPTLSITCPSNITVYAISPAGKVVAYTVSTSGGCPPINVACNPPSGSTFPVGSTTVCCTANDACGQSATCCFNVTVKPPAKPHFFPQPLLPPHDGVYISPALWHVLYAQGIVIRDVRHRFFLQSFPPPPLGTTDTHSFGSQVDFEVSFDNGATFQPGSGNANVTVRITHSQDLAGLQVYDTEMLQLDLFGSGFMLRESPTLQSLGQTTVRPVAGGYLIGSFFDVNTEVSTDGGVSWQPANDSGHVELRPDPSLAPAIGHPTRRLPPPTGGYISPQQWHALFAQGIIIRDVRHKFFTDSFLPPDTGNNDTHSLDSQLDMQVSTDGGGTWTYLRAQAAMTVAVEGLGSAANTLYDTEMTSLAATMTAGGMTLMIRESPTLPSRGSTQIDAQSDGSFRVHSFFDIFPEVSLDGGATWSAATNGPARMELREVSPEVVKPTPNLPPPDGFYVSPQQWHAFYQSGIIITNASHNRFTQTQPPPPPGGSQTENFGSTVTGLISTDGGASFQPFSAPANVAVQVSSRSDDTGPTRFFNTEMLSLSLSGGTLPGGVMVRESPSKASLGRTSVRTTPAGYAIDSFFDVFTEVSTDGGATWSAALTHPGTMGLQPPPTNVPPPTITCPSDITVVALTPAGAVVAYTVGTSGGCPPITVVCNPPSGSNFPVGTTKVCCTANDACGQSASCCFNITVKPPVPQFFFPLPLLPPHDGVYISPALWHVLYANGIVIRDVKHRFFLQSFPPPPLGATETHAFGSQLDFEVSFDNGATFQPGSGQANVTVRVTHTQDTGGQQVYDTEMLQLDLAGPGFMLRESPTLQSLGQTTVRPVAGGYLIGSFFDVFTELSTDGGVSWHPATDSGHVELRPDPSLAPGINHPTRRLPPPTGAYISPQQWHALFAQGIIIRDVRHKLFTQSFLPPGHGSTDVHTLDSQLDMQVSTDGGATWTYLRAPATMTAGAIGEGASDVIAFFTTAMQSLDATLTAGGMTLKIRESPTLPSRGATQIDALPDGTWRIHSFFDIFPEISTDGGATWSAATNGPVRMELRLQAPEVVKPTSNLPPDNGSYVSPQQWHALYQSGIIITNVSHNKFLQTQPPPPPGGSQTENFGSTVSGAISMNGGASFQPFSASANVSVQVTSRSDQDTGQTRFFDTEIVSLGLSGGSLPAGVMLRESPSKASLGRTSVRLGGDGQYRIGSFFDIFTEVSLDGGATWSASITHPGTMAHVTNTPVPILLSCPPNKTVAATSPAGAVVNYGPPSVSGGCPPLSAPVCNPPSGSTFPIGTTTVTCSVSDSCGSTADCSFAVKVVKLIIDITPIGHDIQLSWPVGTLQDADDVEGPYIDVDPQPTSPYLLTPSEAKKFFRVRAGEPGFSYYDTEMLQLEISGGNLPPAVRVRESPTLASTGKTAISPLPDGGFVISSFFDVNTELSMDGGQTWMQSLSSPPRMKFVGNQPSNALPPRDATYVSPPQWHALYAQGIYITNASHLGFLGGSFPPPPPGGNTDIHSFGSTVKMQMCPCFTCPVQVVTAPANVTVKITSRP